MNIRSWILTSLVFLALALILFTVGSNQLELTWQNYECKAGQCRVSWSANNYSDHPEKVPILISYYSMKNKKQQLESIHNIEYKINAGNDNYYFVYIPYKTRPYRVEVSLK